MSLDYSCCNGEHNAVAEGNNSRLHVFIGIVALRDGGIAGEERAAEVFVHKLKGNGHMAYAQAFTVLFGKGNLLGIMVAAIVE